MNCTIDKDNAKYIMKCLDERDKETDRWYKIISDNNFYSDTAFAFSSTNELPNACSMEQKKNSILHDCTRIITN